MRLPRPEIVRREASLSAGVRPKVLISSVFSASNLPIAGRFRRKAEISSAVVLSRPCTAWWYLGSSTAMFLVANRDSKGKPDFRAGGAESWDFNRYSLNSSGDIAHGPNHWGCCSLESDDSVCNSVDVCRIHIGKGRRIGPLQPRQLKLLFFETRSVVEKDYGRAC